jgi:hypothetical protein
MISPPLQTSVRAWLLWIAVMRLLGTADYHQADDCEAGARIGLSVTVSTPATSFAC